MTVAKETTIQTDKKKMIKKTGILYKGSKKPCLLIDMSVPKNNISVNEDDKWSKYKDQEKVIEKNVPP